MTAYLEESAIYCYYWRTSMTEKEATPVEKKKEYTKTSADRDRTTVAIVFTNPQNDQQFFLVKRPDDPTDIFCNTFGFPAATLEEGETIEQAIERIGTDKLGLQITPVEKLTTDTVSRVTHQFTMELWRVQAKGQLKLKRSGRPDITYYAGWKWGTVDDLVATAALGSEGSRLYRRWAGIEEDTSDEISHDHEQTT